MKFVNNLLAIGLILNLSHSAFAGTTNKPAHELGSQGRAEQVKSPVLAESVLMAQLDQAALSQTLAPYGVTPTNGVSIYRLSYNTKSVDDSDLRASGIVIIPDSGSEVFPWISLQHGTITSKAEAPSASPFEGLVEASQGFISVVPDYIGYGDSAELPHPYIIAKGYQRPLVDMLRAAREFALEQKVVLGPLFLKGYSEGGYATLALQKVLETEHAAEFPIAASAPSSGPYDVDLTGTLAVQKPTVNPVNIPFVVLSYNYWLADGQLPVNDIFRTPVAEIESALSGAYSSSEVYQMLPTASSDLFQEDFVTDFLSAKPQLKGSQDLHDLLRSQSLLEGWVPKAPTRFYHCADDELIPAVVTEKAVQKFTAAGATNISVMILPSPSPETPYTHGTCPAIFLPARWFTEVLFGNAMAPAQ